MFIRTTDRVTVNCLQNAALRYVSTRLFTLDAKSGYMLKISRIGHDENGNTLHCASLEQVLTPAGLDAQRVMNVVDSMGSFRLYDTGRNKWYRLKVVDGTMTLEQE